MTLTKTATTFKIFRATRHDIGGAQFPFSQKIIKIVFRAGISADAEHVRGKAVGV
jgi:hypothetical protein